MAAWKPGNEEEATFLHGRHGPMFRLVVTGRVGVAVFHTFSDNHPTGRTWHHAVLLCIFALSVNRNISKSNEILRRYVIDITLSVTK